jgi:hypothetical protein
VVVPSAGVVVSVSGGGVVVVVVVLFSPHPATNIAAQTSINANKLLIAKSPENEMVSKTLAPSNGARIQYGITFAERLVARQLVHAAYRPYFAHLPAILPVRQLTFAVSNGFHRKIGRKIIESAKKSSTPGNLTHPATLRLRRQSPAV